jgi:hypothetical protein
LEKQTGSQLPVKEYSMTIHLLEGTLEVDIFYECEDQDLEDNICIRVIERCPPEEKLLKVGQTHLYLTAAQARQLGEMLLHAASHSNGERFIEE